MPKDPKSMGIFSDAVRWSDPLFLSFRYETTTMDARGG